MRSNFQRAPTRPARTGRQEPDSRPSTRDARARVIALTEGRAAARAFYRGALRGRQVWPTTGGAEARGSLWFLVGATLVEASPEPRVAATPLVLEVDEPWELAERCWDAGFTVVVDDADANRPSLSVVDPFGRRVELVPSGESAVAARRVVGEERR